VFAEHSRPAGRHSQMMDSCPRLKINPVACFAPSVRKFSFEIIGHPNEALVETTNLKCDVAAYGEISCHKIFDPSRPTACKVEFTIAREINSYLPGLDDATSYQAGISLLMSIKVRLN
jgi:hypothetical protein